MSAQDDFINHVGRRYKMDAPVDVKIGYHQERIRILKRYAVEVPAEQKWAAAKIAESNSFIVGLRRGDV